MTADIAIRLCLAFALIAFVVERTANIKRDNQAINDRGDGPDGDAGMDFDSTHNGGK